MSFGDMLATGMDVTSLFKSLLDLTKGIKELGSETGAKDGQLIERTAETMRDKLSELQQKHLELQQIAFALSQQNSALLEEKRRFEEEKRTLEEELSRLQKFDAERELFEPVRLALNTFAFAEKALDGSPEDKPLLCPNCFNAAEKCYLSFKEYAPRTNTMECSSCGTIVHVPREEGFSAYTAPSRNVTSGWNDL